MYYKSKFLEFVSSATPSKILGCRKSFLDVENHSWVLKRNPYNAFRISLEQYDKFVI